MADIVVTIANVLLPNERQNIIIRGVAGGTILPGDTVYLDGNNGWKKGDADAAASGQVRGIAISSGGALSYATGESLDIVVYGPVSGFASMTPGGAVFQSVTAGLMDQSSPALGGDFPFAVGWAMSASVIFVHPQITVPTVNP